VEAGHSYRLTTGRARSAAARQRSHRQPWTLYA
jgi:hypothetical protein